MKRTTFVRWCAPLLALGLLASACGDDDDDTSADSTTPEETTTLPPSEELTELCALAQEMYDQDSFPTEAQIEQYRGLAPESLQDSISVAGDAIVEAGDDVVAFFVAVADDEVEAANTEINAFEEANCGIPHSEDNVLPEGASREEEDDANKVAVTAIEYDFTYDEPIEAGRTSFVLTNDGAEAHFLGVGKLKEGVTLDDALQSEDSSAVLDGEWDSDLAAPGGDDEEVITFDLEPGEYAFVCFIPSADGTPHAFQGMAKAFTVA
jgi:hypothetical protein